jgi:hypothetical protein
MMAMFQTLLAAAALLVPGQLVMIDLALDPEAAGKRPVPFDAPGFRAVIAQQLAQSGVPVGAGEGMTRLVIRVTSYDPGNGIALDQTARLSARFQLLPASGAPSEEMTVSCEGKAKFDLANTPGGRARRAYARCLNELAVRMTGKLVGSEAPVMVR